MAGERRCATSSGGGITLGKSVRRVKMGVNPAGRDLAFCRKKLRRLSRAGEGNLDSNSFRQMLQFRTAGN